MVKLKENMDYVFTIAEVGLNHNGDIKSALEHVEAAKKAGCDAVKFQTYITEKRVPKHKNEMRDLLKKFELTYKEFEEIKAFSDDIGIEFFSTAFDEEAVNFLSSINVKMFKLASFDTENNKLIEAVLKKADKIIFSTGMTTSKTVRALAERILKQVDQLVILHCVSSYPTPSHSARLANISSLIRDFPSLTIGYSDHTQGTLAPAVAVGLGATVIEKHFKVSEHHDCVDAPVSLGPEKMKEMIFNIKEAYSMIGSEFFGVSDIETPIIEFQRKS